MSGVAEPASDSKERSDDQIAAVFKSADDAERMRRGDRPDLCGAAGIFVFPISIAKIISVHSFISCSISLQSGMPESALLWKAHFPPLR